MKISHNFICLISLILMTEPAFSSGAAHHFFEFATYIDTDYKAPDYTEINYVQNVKFDILTKQFINPEYSEEIKYDYNYRNESEKYEPEKYRKYLYGKSRFDVQDYQRALDIFSEIYSTEPKLDERILKLINKEKYSWTREASAYMIARCNLIMSQNDWDGHNDIKGVINQELLEKADDAYLSYLNEFPNGLYAKSAKNIRKKIYFLAGKRSELDTELRKSVNNAFSSVLENDEGTKIDPEIFNEFKNFFRGKVDISKDSLILIAYAWLGNSQIPTQDDIKTLEEREKEFSNLPELFRFTRALGLYRTKDFQGLIDKTPERKLENNAVSLSAELLRSRAFAELKRTDEAISALKNMLSVSPEEATEMDIAFLEVNNGTAIRMYSENAPINTEQTLRIFAVYALSDDEIEKALSTDKSLSETGRKYLTDEIERRYLLSERYKELADFLANNPGSGIFTPILHQVSALSKNRKDANALTDIAEFIYTNGIMPDTIPVKNTTLSTIFYNAYDDLAPRCKKCEQYQERLKTYKAPIFLFKDAATHFKASGKKSETEAKALHYLSICLKQGSSKEQCTWKIGWKYNNEKDDTAEKAFKRLHKLYKSSDWAEKTPYYF